MTTGGIVLCGGKSRRVGRCKGMLPLGPERVPQRGGAGPVLAAPAVGQELPQLAATTGVVRDRRPHRGPLEGLRAGLETLRYQADAAFVTACDVPLLMPPFVRRMIELPAGFHAAVP